MRRLPVLLLLSLCPAAALAQEPQEPQGVTGGDPTGLVAAFSFGAGGELGLDSGKAGIVELEALVGWELESVGLRPEFAVALGVAPDSNVALRPGVRWTIPGFPIQLRAAVDVSNARDSGLRWRWLLVGAAGEVRFTSLLGLYGEIDTGAPLGSESGLPLVLRAGTSFRF